MSYDFLEFFANRGTLVDPKTAGFIAGQDDPKKFVEGIVANLKDVPLFLTMDNLPETFQISANAPKNVEINEFGPENGNNGGAKYEKKMETEMPLKTPRSGQNGGGGWKRARAISREENFQHPAGDVSNLDKEFEAVRGGELGNLKSSKSIFKPARELDGQMRIIKDMTGNSTCEGDIRDFSLYFNDRVKKITKLLRSRPELYGARKINGIRRGDKNLKLIGIVSDIRITKNGHKLLEIEDSSGKCAVLLKKDDGLSADTTINDEVIGIVAEAPERGDLIMAKQIVRPDIKATNKVNRADEPLSAAFISDIHLGNKTFLEDRFKSFIQWLGGNGNGKATDALDRLKYIMVTGDIVDGIGIYPGQEEELVIDDIYAQYEEVARLMDDIPEHIKIVMIPGNHDAVRGAIPQPALPEEFTRFFSNNVTFASNPCQIGLSGVEVLLKHGRALDDLVTSIPGMGYDTAIFAMKEMLKRRHMAPIYGGKTQLAPEHVDHMVIDRVPDIFALGHGHAHGVGKYRGVTLINASTWESQTSFQKMMNFTPDPGKVTLVDLQSHKVDVVNF